MAEPGGMKLEGRKRERYWAMGSPCAAIRESVQGVSSCLSKGKDLSESSGFLTPTCWIASLDREVSAGKFKALFSV